MKNISNESASFTRLTWIIFFSTYYLPLVIGIVVVFLLFYYSPPTLDRAIKNNDVAQAEQVLDEYPAALELPVKPGLTPFLRAVWANKIEVVRLLIRRGADVHSTCRLAYKDGNWNAFHLVYGVEIAEMLMKVGVDFNAVSLKGETPLDVALKRDKIEIVDFLRAHSGKTAAEISK